MKIIRFLVLFLSTNPIAAQQNNLAIKDTHSNLAIFITDFVSNSFEGGTIYYLQKNDTDSLLFKIDYLPPSDFGSIEFKHLPSGRIIFKGGINWSGLGKIEKPDTIIKPSAFLATKRSVKRPKQYKYYKYFWVLESYIKYPKIMANELLIFEGENKYFKEFEKLSSLEAFINRTWKSLANLKMTKDFVKKKCKVGFYLYTPAVGVFNPSEAKWITFLYIN